MVKPTDLPNVQLRTADHMSIGTHTLELENVRCYRIDPSWSREDVRELLTKKRDDRPGQQLDEIIVKDKDGRLSLLVVDDLPFGVTAGMQVAGKGLQGEIVKKGVLTEVDWKDLEHRWQSGTAGAALFYLAPMGRMVHPDEVMDKYEAIKGAEWLSHAFAIGTRDMSGYEKLTNPKPVPTDPANMPKGTPK